MKVFIDVVVVAVVVVVVICEEVGRELGEKEREEVGKQGEF